MTITSFPFENQTTSETQYSYLFRELNSSGINGSSDANDFRLTPSASTLVATLAAGRATVRGFMAINDANLPVSFDSVATGQRIDTVVLRLNPASDSIVMAVVKGTSVAAPTLTQTDSGVYELPIADVTVLASGALNILDRRRFAGMDVGCWTTEARPATPRRGKLGYNTTLSYWEFWDGTQWKPLVPVVPDSGWISCPMKSGFDAASFFKVRKIGSQVFAQARVASTSTLPTTLKDVATLPVGYTAAVAMRHAAGGTPSSTPNAGLVELQPGDRVVRWSRVGTTTGGLYLSGNLSWLVD